MPSRGTSSESALSVESCPQSTTEAAVPLCGGAKSSREKDLLAHSCEAMFVNSIPRPSPVSMKHSQLGPGLCRLRGTTPTTQNQMEDYMPIAIQGLKLLDRALAKMEMQNGRALYKC